MKVIYKYQLIIDDRQIVVMPKGAEILCVQVQNNIPCIWAKVNTGKVENEERIIFIFETGHTIYNEELKYLGTFQLIDGNIVFHVFENKKWRILYNG